MINISMTPIYELSWWELWIMALSIFGIMAGITYSLWWIFNNIVKRFL